MSSGFLGRGKIIASCSTVGSEIADLGCTTSDNEDTIYALVENCHANIAP